MKRIRYESISDTIGGIAILKYSNFLYTAGEEGFTVYDLKNPAHPRKLQTMTGFGQCRQMAVSNGILYLTARHFGLWILSLENPASPKVINRFDTVELATGLAVHENYVFVSERIYGIEMIDCTDPLHPRHLSLMLSDEAQSAVFHQGKLYAGEWGSSRLSVFDYSNFYVPKLLGQYPLGGFGDGVAIQDDICCCATGLNSPKAGHGKVYGDGHGLDIFQLDANGMPIHISRIDFPVLKMKSNDFWSVRIAGKYAFVADTFNGVFQVDISDPFHPVSVGRIELPQISKKDGYKGQISIVKISDCAGGVAVGDGFLYIIGHKTGLHVAGIPEITAGKRVAADPFTFKPVPKKTKSLSGFECLDLDGQVRRISVDEKNQRLFAACSHAGIKIINLSGHKMQVIADKQVRCSYDVIFRDGKLYSAEGLDGLAIYQVDGCKLTELGRFRRRMLNIQLITLTENGRFAVCGSHDGLLRFFDISVPEAIRKVRRHCHGGLLYDDSSPEHDIRQKMPVNWPYAGFCWYDFSGDVPRIILNDHSWCPTGQCQGVAVWRNKFLFNTVEEDFWTFDPADPSAPPVKLGSGCSGIPSIDGDFLAVSHHRNGEIRCFQLTSKGVKPIPKRSVSGLSGLPGRVRFYRNRMVIPCGWQGLLIEKA